ncbi:hypothetical protein [Campylobacter sp.]|uniref:hypothetical protein n=1 Tax=Campylobacter sp. TaxID=205 RepID=UPI002AA858E5|nr:hypothetical protein [Campylobacter sp.]MCI6660712.1 hypothetical protein [Campylobacter sp.]
MTAIKSFLKFLVLCYHLPFRWTFLFWAPLVVLAPLMPFIVDYDKVGVWDVMALSIFYIPFLAYIKGRYCDADGDESEKVIFYYKIFGITRPYAIRSLCFDILCLNAILAFFNIMPGKFYIYFIWSLFFKYILPF